MSPERYQEFVDRITAEIGTLYLHWQENPELAHFTRVATLLSTMISVVFCGAMREHWNCLVATTGIGQSIFALAFIKPSVLEEIYTDFKPDFEEMVPPGLLNYAAVEYREYPIPDELQFSQPPNPGPV